MPDLGSASTKRVEVVSYDPAWQDCFEELRADLLKILSGLDVRVEHVGSTSVPGLAAKPILDIDVVLQSSADFEQIKAALEEGGYYHVGDLGITGREAFKYDNKPHHMRHHLYVLQEGSEELKRHLVFRDWLRSDPEDRELYASVKIAAAERFPDNIGAYIDAKSDVIFEIYRRCGLYRPQDLPELAKSVVNNRYDLRVVDMVCRSVQLGVSLCQAQTTQGISHLLVWENAGSANGESALDLDKIKSMGATLPLPTASGQLLCGTPFATFALFGSEQDAESFLNSIERQDKANSEESHG